MQSNWSTPYVLVRRPQPRNHYTNFWTKFNTGILKVYIVLYYRPPLLTMKFITTVKSIRFQKNYSSVGFKIVYRYAMSALLKSTTNSIQPLFYQIQQKPGKSQLQR